MPDQTPWGQSSFPPPSPSGQPIGGQQPQGSQSPQPAVPPPPPPPITVRTMGSDIKSMQSSGGTPIPQQVKPAELRNFAASNEEPLFSPTSNASPQSSLTPEGRSTGWLKVIGWTVGIIIILGGLGFAGYYYVYPLIFPQNKVAETPPAETTTPSPSPAPKTLAHTSFFTTSAAQTNALSLTEITALSVNAAISGMPTSTTPLPTLKEIVLSDGDGQIASSKFISSLIPTLSSDELSRNFEDDFTTYVYADKNGAWPGYILRLKQNAMLIEAQSLAKKIETADTATLKSLYPKDPGALADATQTNPFKNGQIGTTQTRYVVFKNPGAALNYGVISNYLIISTSYDGIKDAAKRLGL